MLVPRETPLSSIHLENLLDAPAGGRDDPLRRAGLLPRRRDDRRPRRLRRRARASTSSGSTTTLVAAVGASERRRPARCPPEGVRTMFDRIAPVYDVMNRVMTAGLDRRWRRLDGRGGRAARRPRARRLLRHRRPRARGAQRRAGRSPASTSPSAMLERARRKSPTLEWVAGRRCSRCRSRTRRSTRPRSASASATSPTSSAALRELRARAARRAAGSRSSRSRARAGCSRPSTGSGSTASCPLLGKVLPGGAAYTYLPASVRRFPGPEELAEADRRGRLRRRRATGSSPAGSSRCTRRTRR